MKTMSDFFRILNQKIQDAENKREESYLKSLDFPIPSSSPSRQKIYNDRYCEFMKEGE